MPSGGAATLPSTRRASGGRTRAPDVRPRPAGACLLELAAATRCEEDPSDCTWVRTRAPRAEDCTARLGQSQRGSGVRAARRGKSRRARRSPAGARRAHTQNAPSGAGSRARASSVSRAGLLGLPKVQLTSATRSTSSLCGQQARSPARGARCMSSGCHRPPRRPEVLPVRAPMPDDASRERTEPDPETALQVPREACALRWRSVRRAAAAGRRAVKERLTQRLEVPSRCDPRW